MLIVTTHTLFECWRGNSAQFDTNLEIGRLAGISTYQLPLVALGMLIDHG
jgi:hypothetical protein